VTEKILGSTVSKLPAEVTSFVGRRRELAEAKRLLSSSRLLTLVGPGGVGKTRLALHLADDIRRAFTDGVWLVELADLRSPALLPHSVAAVLGLQDGPSGWTLETVVDSIADKRLLLVLDNCEHLVDSCAAFVHGLLAAAPELQIVATSRETLKAPAEQVLPVPSLSFPIDDTISPARDLLHYEAVQLFVARAAARLPGFTLDDRNRDDVARICRRLEGIPLAIELAADRVRAMSPKQINDRLSSRLALLSTGARGVPTRQQTLRASIDWSYELCSDAEKALWARLSVFVGGFELDAAEGVCAGPDLPIIDVADLVSSLLEKSVLTREERGSYVRYRMLETIREYAERRLLESGDQDQLRRRHRDWYAQLVADAYDQWVGPAQLEWHSRLRFEHPNVRAALEHSLADPLGCEKSLRIGTSLVHYWIARGLLSEGRHWLDEALSRCEPASAARAAALCVNAYLALYQYDFDTADARLAEAQEVLREVDSLRERAFLNFVRATRVMFTDSFTDALRLLDDALTGFRDCGDLTGEIWTLIVLGIAGAVGGEHERAMDALQRCLRRAEERSESWFRSYALLALGINYWAQSDWTKAKEVLKESLTLKEPLSDQLGLAWCFETLAWVSTNEKKDERAATLLGMADGAWPHAGVTLRPFARLWSAHEGCEAALRNRLSDRAFDTYRRRGLEMTSDRALAYALGDQETPAAPQRAEPTRGPLTPREWQIAEAVAEGLSNRQIATRFVIAQRTAEGHVEHILTKLGFTSRAQIAAWVSERLAKADAPAS
jgi:non-specific serine/threonine protein kinase